VFRLSRLMADRADNQERVQFSWEILERGFWYNYKDENKFHGGAHFNNNKKIMQSRFRNVKHIMICT